MKDKNKILWNLLIFYSDNHFFREIKFPYFYLDIQHQEWHLLEDQDTEQDHVYVKRQVKSRCCEWTSNIWISNGGIVNFTQNLKRPKKEEEYISFRENKFNLKNYRFHQRFVLGPLILNDGHGWSHNNLTQTIIFYRIKHSLS